MGWLLDCVACGVKVDVPCDVDHRAETVCGPCGEIKTKAPEIFAWVVRVVKDRLEGHVSDYRHDHYDND